MKINSVTLINSIFVICGFTNDEFEDSSMRNSSFIQSQLLGNNTDDRGRYDFSRISPDYSDFRQTHMLLTKFSSTNLFHSNFDDTILNNVIFDDQTSLAYSNFRKASLTNVHFLHVNLSYSNFCDAHLEHVNFTSSTNLVYSDLSRTRLENIHIVNANITGSNINITEKDVTLSNVVLPNKAWMIDTSDLVKDDGGESNYESLVVQHNTFGLTCHVCARGSDGCGTSFNSKGAGVYQLTGTSTTYCAKIVAASNTNAITRAADASTICTSTTVTVAAVTTGTVKEDQSSYTYQLDS
ncbi:unnamed protein product [Rotaria sordida]|uniref:Uncharacterized protein n=1 Tax=Rotaria sordida TaxID=392033 RepID=A0A814HSC3_9BILA|nr:unnamed protein product [Rotaria sordida]